MPTLRTIPYSQPPPVLPEAVEPAEAANVQTAVHKKNKEEENTTSSCIDGTASPVPANHNHHPPSYHHYYCYYYHYYHQCRGGYQPPTPPAGVPPPNYSSIANNYWHPHEQPPPPAYFHQCPPPAQSNYPSFTNISEKSSAAYAGNGRICVFAATNATSSSVTSSTEPVVEGNGGRKIVKMKSTPITTKGSNKIVRDKEKNNVITGKALSPATAPCPAVERSSENRNATSSGLAPPPPPYYYPNYDPYYHHYYHLRADRAPPQVPQHSTHWHPHQQPPPPYFHQYYPTAATSNYPPCSPEVCKKSSEKAGNSEKCGATTYIATPPSTSAGEPVAADYGGHEFCAKETASGGDASAIKTTPVTSTVTGKEIVKDDKNIIAGKALLSTATTAPGHAVKWSSENRNTMSTPVMVDPLLQAAVTSTTNYGSGEAMKAAAEVRSDCNNFGNQNSNGKITGTSSSFLKNDGENAMHERGGNGDSNNFSATQQLDETSISGTVTTHDNSWTVDKNEYAPPQRGSSSLVRKRCDEEINCSSSSYKKLEPQHVKGILQLKESASTLTGTLWGSSSNCARSNSTSSPKQQEKDTAVSLRYDETNAAQAGCGIPTKLRKILIFGGRDNATSKKKIVIQRCPCKCNNDQKVGFEASLTEFRTGNKKRLARFIEDMNATKQDKENNLHYRTKATTRDTYFSQKSEISIPGLSVNDDQWAYILSTINTAMAYQQFGSNDELPKYGSLPTRLKYVVSEKEYVM